MTNTEQQARELLPCPFCGSTAIIASVTSGPSDALMVACGYCYTRGPRKNTTAEAIAAWNTRAALGEAAFRRAFQGYGRAARDQDAPPLDGEPYMSIDDAARISARLVADVAHNPDLEGLVERLNSLVTCGCVDEEWPQLRHDIVAALSTIQPPAIEDIHAFQIYEWRCVHCKRVFSGPCPEQCPFDHCRSFAKIDEVSAATPSPLNGDVVEALKEIEQAGTAVLAAMDSYNEKHGTYLGGPAFFKLGRAVARARATLLSGKATSPPPEERDVVEAVLSLIEDRLCIIWSPRDNRDVFADELRAALSSLSSGEGSGDE